MTDFATLNAVETGADVKRAFAAFSNPYSKGNRLPSGTPSLFSGQRIFAHDGKIGVVYIDAPDFSRDPDSPFKDIRKNVIPVIYEDTGQGFRACLVATWSNSVPEHAERVASKVWTDCSAYFFRKPLSSFVYLPEEAGNGKIDLLYCVNAQAERAKLAQNVPLAMNETPVLMPMDRVPDLIRTKAAEILKALPPSPYNAATSMAYNACEKASHPVILPPR